MGNNSLSGCRGGVTLYYRLNETYVSIRVVVEFWYWYELSLRSKCIRVDIAAGKSFLLTG